MRFNSHNLVIPPPALIQQGEVIQCLNVAGLFAGQGYENGHIRGIVLGTSAIWVEVDSPVVASDGESVAGHVHARPHTLGQRVPGDRIQVRATDRLIHGRRTRLAP